jgi:hypothetical protein
MKDFLLVTLVARSFLVSRNLTRCLQKNLRLLLILIGDCFYI